MQRIPRASFVRIDNRSLGDARTNERACPSVRNTAGSERPFVGLTCKRIQVDEIWAFVYAKQKNVATAKKASANAGDIWTWTAIDADGIVTSPLGLPSVTFSRNHR
jgi:hypothetical protein